MESPFYLSPTNIKERISKNLNRKKSIKKKTTILLNKCTCINPLTPEDFHVFERFSAFTRPIGLRDPIFKVTIESAAVLKH